MQIQSSRTFAQATDRFIFKTRQELAKLVLVFGFVADEVADVGELFDFLRGVKIDLSFWGRDSQKAIIYDQVPLLHIQEINSAGEGTIPVFGNGASIIKCLADIDLGVGGQLDLDGSGYFQLTVTGLAGAGVDGTVQVNGIQSPVYVSHLPYLVNLPVLTENRSEALELGDYSTLAIPFDGFERVTLHYTGGVDQELDQDDLYIINANTNDLLTASVSAGGGEHFSAAVDHCVIDVSGVARITVQKPEGTPFRMLGLLPTRENDGVSAFSKNAQQISTL